MNTLKINELQAFLSVANDQSFTKAAAKMGVTASALSHTIKGLEIKLGVRLLNRTTRNVAPTEAGEKLMHSIGPLFDQIATEIKRLGELRDEPVGSIRITCSDYVAEMILRPKLAKFLAEYPGISVEISIDYGFRNIIQERFDAGIRLRESISKDMIAVRLGPNWRFAIVGSPAYFDKHATPESPKDLIDHICINMRSSSTAGLYTWEFEKDGQKLNIRVNGQFSSNSPIHILNAALDGLGLAYVPESLAKPYLVDGRLKEVLADWCPYLEGYHLYYPNREQASPAFVTFVEALKYRV